MSSSILNGDNSKRTRSQLTIPDFLFQGLPLARSPLKDARTALRNRQPEVDSGTLHLGANLNLKASKMSADDSEDEILLSPKKKKRPSSPIAEELNSTGEPDMKRSKLDPLPALTFDDAENHNVPPSAPRRRTKTRPFQRAATASASKKPSSTSTKVAPATDSSPSRQRAQSVPLHSSDAPFSIPHLDFSTPLRSPSKNPFKLRVTSVPPLEPIRDTDSRKETEKGPSVSMEVETPRPSPSTPPPADPVPTIPDPEVTVNVNDEPVPMTVSTPRKTNFLAPFGSPMSPLTPLPPTPHLSKFALDDEEVSDNLGWAHVAPTPIRNGVCALSKVPSISTTHPTSNHLAAPMGSTTPAAMTAPSRLPRPSSLLMPPPSTIPAHATQNAQKEKEKSQQKVTKSTAIEKAKAKVPLGGRVTRSASLKQKQKAAAASTSGTQTGGTVVTQSSDHRKSTSFAFSFAAPTSSSANKTREKGVASSGTTSKPSSPAKPSPSKNIYPGSSPVRPTPKRPSSSVFSSASSSSSIPNGTSSSSVKPAGAASSLSTLSNALEKLTLPRPQRPGTSLGFREGERQIMEDSKRGKDDGGIGMARASGIGLGRPSVGLKRAATIGAVHMTSSSKAAGPTPRTANTTVAAKAPASGPSSPAKRGPFSFAPPAGAVKPAGRINLTSGVVVGSNRFGMGANGRGKVSRKTSLPSVAASPVKGGGSVQAESSRDAKTPSRGGASTDDDDVVVTSDKDWNDVFSDSGAGDDKGKGKEEPNARPDVWKKNASRRASLASQALSQSLSSFPEPQPGQSSGGKRSTSSTYPSSNGMRSAPGALGGKVRGGSGGHVSGTSSTANNTGGKGGEGPVGQVLRDCTIFVDVRTDDGDDAGGLFVDMLRGMGAKILGRAGQTCTHIVYKNGLMSTLTRYRLLNEPRPLVVGIAWVVECVEQRAKVDEAKFQIDLEGVNVAGMNKRRRSMLPKHVPNVASPASNPLQESGDVSMRAPDQSIDGSSSSMILDGDEIVPAKKDKDELDDLPPLERARRRRAMLGKR